jgi:hypothetical protein
MIEVDRLRTNTAVTATFHNVALLWRQADWWSFGLIVIASGIMVWRFWLPGIPNPGDMMMGIHRLYELVQSWQFGVYYPRIGPDLNFNYGAPLFEFYPPLASYVGLIFYGLGLDFVQASKATFTGATVLAGLGVYV